MVYCWLSPWVIQIRDKGWIGGGSGKFLPCPIPYTVYGLQLFTAYILVQACTSGGCVTQKLIRVKIDPAGSLLVAIIDPAGSLLAAKSDPPLQKVIRVQILVDSSLF